MKLRYHNITKDDMLNGDGLRVVLWVAGCEHHCPGCQNEFTHDLNGGLEFTDKELHEIWNELDKDYIAGLTLSGGDPLHPKNREYITWMCKFMKTNFPNKTIWCYTGYLFEQIKDLPVMQYIDVLVDGPFIQEFADVKYHWAGSTNQRIWRKVNGEWRGDADERTELEARSTETGCGCRDS